MGFYSVEDLVTRLHTDVIISLLEPRNSVYPQLMGLPLHQAQLIPADKRHEDETQFFQHESGTVNIFHMLQLIGISLLLSNAVPRAS